MKNPSLLGVGLNSKSGKLDDSSRGVNSINRKTKLLVVALSAFLFFGCASESSEGQNDASSSGTGKFIDSAVEGVSYTSGSLSGTTDSEGTFRYELNGSVTFTLGGITLGSGTAKATMTPIDLVPDATDSTDQTVMNIARMLQSLDSDGNPANGIRITEQIRLALNDTTIDISGPSSGFGAKLGQIVSDLSTDHGIPLTLVTETEAKQHLDDAIAVINTVVTGVDNSLALSATNSSPCALSKSGSIQCWGWNEGGQLGNGNQVDSSTPVTVSGISNAIAIGSGPTSVHNCAVLADGSVRCWGNGWGGCIVPGSTSNRAYTTPASVSGITNAVFVNTGSYSSCAVTADGLVKCWGNSILSVSDTSGQTQIITIPGISDAKDVCHSSGHGCSTQNNGTVKCWGEDFNGLQGAHGNGNTEIQTSAELVSGISNAVKLKCISNGYCALLADGSIKCWGSGIYAGDGNGSSNQFLPVRVRGISTAVDISMRGYNCAVLKDKTLRCWGQNYYLDDTKAADYFYTPRTISGITNASKVASGHGYTLVSKNNGGIVAWGRGRYGVLGNGSTEDQASPITVSGFSGTSTGGGGTTGDGYDFPYTCPSGTSGTAPIPFAQGTPCAIHAENFAKTVGCNEFGPAAQAACVGYFTCVGQTDVSFCSAYSF